MANHLMVLKGKDPELRKISEPVLIEDIKNNQYKNLIEDMKLTMREENGIGIASPQIGILKRIIIVETSKGTIEAFYNPTITQFSFGQIESEEGCLSVPGIFGLVKRSKRITLSAIDENGLAIQKELSGLQSIVFQHEIDHLNGILFIDKVFKYTKLPHGISL